LQALPSFAPEVRAIGAGIIVLRAPLAHRPWDVERRLFRLLTHQSTGIVWDRPTRAQSRGSCVRVRLLARLGHEVLMNAHSARLSLVGRTLAHYRINHAIGAGGMGEVYRATDMKLGRDVALKILPPDVASDPERLARFQREARTVAALNHPNVITLYSVEE